MPFRDRVVEIHPISEYDIIELDAGDTLVAPQRGAFLSDLYIDQVMKARINK